MQKIPFNSNWKVQRKGDEHGIKYPRKSVVIPHDAMFETKRTKDVFEGTKKAFFENGAWEYTKVFDISDDLKNKTLYIEFEGVMSNALVYVNGNAVCSHIYGYTEFFAEISPYIQNGKNIIKVICHTDNDSRWYTGAGIYRDVNLLAANQEHFAVNGIKLRTLSADNCNAEIYAEVKTNNVTDGEVKITFTDFNGNISEGTIRIKNNYGIGKIEIRKCLLWNLEEPNLYDCRAELICNDSVTDIENFRYGIRTLSVNTETGLLINGKQVKLRGACIHHDNGIIGARTFKCAEYRRIKKLKEAGFNSIRSAHNPISRHLLDACDKYGILVVDEAFDMWENPKSYADYSNHFEQNWKKDIAAMIEKCFNHPSVIMYSLGNEIPELANIRGKEILEELSEYVRRLDDSRFITLGINGTMVLMSLMEVEMALNGQEGNVTEQNADINERMDDMGELMNNLCVSPVMDGILKGVCGKIDILGYNYMGSRYIKDLNDEPERVIVGSETFPKDIAFLWGHIEEHNNVIGDFTWAGWDYLGETGLGKVYYGEKLKINQGFYGIYPWIAAKCGDIDLTGYRLPQSYYREIVYGLRKQPYIAVHRPRNDDLEEHKSTWGWDDVVSSWDFKGHNGNLIVDIYSPDDVELFLNAKSLGKKECGKHTGYKTSYVIPFECGELKAVTTQGEYILLTTNRELELRLIPETVNDDDELLYVECALCDDKGTYAYGNDIPIKIEICGGELIGFGSGETITEENYCDSICTTKDGRAVAVIYMRDRKITVKAQANGFQSVEKTILR